MRPAQPLLFADPRPLVERLGGDFFRQAPERPGVYLMRDAAGRVLYVGKAKNLRQRLGNYRIANPDQMPRRHLRMVREVARIEFQFCPGESAALKHESRLLRALKPKFNRAGVWPGKTRFLAWRCREQCLELAVVNVPETGWRRFGPLGGGASSLQGTLARLLWLAVRPERAVSELPAGWGQGRVADNVTISCVSLMEKITEVLDAFFWAEPTALLAWLEARFATRTHLFERSVISAELEALQEFSNKRVQRRRDGQQFALL